MNNLLRIRSDHFILSSGSVDVPPVPEVILIKTLKPCDGVLAAVAADVHDDLPDVWCHASCDFWRGGHGKQIPNE